jgi:hypothetical protein
MSNSEHESAAPISRVTSKDGTSLAVTATGRGAPVILIGGAFNDRSTVAALDLPVLAMYGDRTSAALEWGTRAVAEAVPGAELLAIPGQDHGVLQHPETIEPALAKFFAGR